MRVLLIGTGYVGLATFASNGRAIPEFDVVFITVAIPSPGDGQPI